MRSNLFVLPVIGVSFLLSGCIIVSRSSFSLDFVTGELQRTYYGLASKLAPDEKDYSVAGDWASLKEEVADKKPEFDPDVVQDVSKVLFEQNKELCGRKIQKVKCPKCFPSKAALLTYLHDEKEWRFDLVIDTRITNVLCYRHETIRQPIATGTTTFSGNRAL